MKEFLTIGLFGFIGISLGAILKFKHKSIPTILSRELSSTTTIQKIEISNEVFSQKEISFLKQLIVVNLDKSHVSTYTLCEILQIQLVSNSQKRILCNNFLKCLNLKIFVKYGVKDAILALGSEQDKRKKCYQLDHRFFKLIQEK
jgi:hypothetical protein